jgi:hypothetical protein
LLKRSLEYMEEKRRVIPVEHNASASTTAAEAELTKICASETFRQATTLRKMLRYVVDETLAGRADELKEYTVATRGLGLPETFDPTLDGRVRTYAKRIRDHLKQYYEKEGAGDPIIITMPVGGYVVRLPTRDRAPGRSLRMVHPTDRPAPSTEDICVESYEPQTIRVRIRSFHTGTETELTVPNTATIDWFTQTASREMKLSKSADVGSFERLYIRWVAVDVAVYKHWKKALAAFGDVVGMFVNDVNLIIPTRSDWRDLMVWFGDAHRATDDFTAREIKQELSARPYALSLDATERLADFGVKDGCTFYLVGVQKNYPRPCFAIP